MGFPLWRGTTKQIMGFLTCHRWARSRGKSTNLGCAPCCRRWAPSPWKSMAVGCPPWFHRRALSLGRADGLFPLGRAGEGALLVVAVDEVWLGSCGSQASVAERVLQKWQKGLDGNVGWQILNSEPEEISGGAMDKIDDGWTRGVGVGHLTCDTARLRASLLMTSMS